MQNEVTGGSMGTFFNLIATEGEKKGSVYNILQSPFKIGRMSDNNIVLEDKTVSRYHSEIIEKNNKYLIKDLGSHNGTFVNGVIITSVNLKAGDRITIGKNTFLFDSEKEDIFSDEDTKSYVTIKPAKAILKDIMEEKRKDSSLEVPKQQANILSAMYLISKGILKESEIGPILNIAADMILKHIKAERVFFLVKDKETNSLKPALMRGINVVSSGENKLLLSKTVVDRVINEGISLLVADAKRDVRFQESKSIFLYGICSAMCVPLLGTLGVTGTIYADSLNAEQQFTQDELNLLTTIGNLTAIALEGANLRDKIRKEKEVRLRLTRYHSPQVVEEIIKDRATCEVKESTITVLFIDIQGFTRLSEQFGPIGTSALLNEYFDIITKIVFRYNGSIDKFIGDAAMAIFGAPLHKRNYTEMAVRAAVDIMREIRKLNKYDIRIGINTGHAVIGNIGSSERIEYTAIGDTVNIASRLEKLAGPGQIYVGDTTYEQIKGNFNTKAVGNQKLRGKSAEVKVYEVLI